MAWTQADWFLSILNIGDGRHDEFRSILIWFAAGMALALPLGIFMEVLRGLQRIAVANAVIMACSLVGFGLLVAALRGDWGFRNIVLVALGSTLAPHLVAGFTVSRYLPQLRLHWRLIRLGWIGRAMRFSASAYVILLSYMIMTKTDTLVLGTCLSLSAVTWYLPGAKLGELFSVVTKQLADTLQPAAAQLNALGDTAGVRRLLRQGLRYSVLLATPLFLVCLASLEPLLRAITGETHRFTETWWVACILVVWAYNFVITHNVFKRIAVMCGHEGRLVRIGLAEAALNLGLSVGLLLLFQSVLVVALSTLLASLVCGWGFLWRWAAEEAGCRPAEFARATLLGALRANLPLAALLAVAFNLPWFAASQPLWHWMGLWLVAGSTALAGLWLTGLLPAERQFVINRLKRVHPVTASAAGDPPPPIEERYAH